MKALIICTVLVLLVGCTISSTQITPQPVSVSSTTAFIPTATPTSTPAPTATLMPTPTMLLALGSIRTPIILIEPAPLLNGNMQSSQMNALNLKVVPRFNAVGVADLYVDLVPVHCEYFPEESFVITVTIVGGLAEFFVDSNGKYVSYVEPKQMTFLVKSDRPVTWITMTVPIANAMEGDTVELRFSLDLVQ